MWIQFTDQFLRCQEAFDSYFNLLYYVDIMQNKIAAVLVSILTIGIFLVTITPQTRGYINSMFVLYIVVASVGLLYYPVIRKHVSSERVLSLYGLVIFVCLILWVGVTGWFFSPFFYLLYLVAIVLAFMYSPFVTFSFTITLLGLFAPNIGSIDTTIDIITMLSLFSVVPLTYFLQKEYLRLKENEKKVLILDDEKRVLKNKVDEVLLNKVIKFSAQLREPVNDMRQLALVAQRHKDPSKISKAFHQIIKLGEESLNKIEEFEEKVTGKNLVHTKKG